MLAMGTRLFDNLVCSHVWPFSCQNQTQDKEIKGGSQVGYYY